MRKLTTSCDCVPVKRRSPRAGVSGIPTFGFALEHRQFPTNRFLEKTSGIERRIGSLCCCRIDRSSIFRNLKEWTGRSTRYHERQAPSRPAQRNIQAAARIVGAGKVRLIAWDHESMIAFEPFCLVDRADRLTRRQRSRERAATM